MINNRGQSWAYGMMLAMVVVILVLALSPVGKSFVDSAMNQTVGDAIGLDCANESISNFDKGTCVIVDFSLVYFFGGLLLIGTALLISKIIVGGITE